MHENSILRSTWFIVILTLYFLAGMILYFPLRYQLNPDGIAYMTLAKDYYNGYWGDAVNAYWSPLISWIIALFCWIPADPLFVFKWYNLFAGSIGLFATMRLMKFLQAKLFTQQLFLGLFAIIFLRFVYITTTPDLTVTVLLLLFLPYWLSGQMIRKPVNTALWLALLYFAKAYNFYFGAALILMDFCQLLINKEVPVKKIVQNLAVVFGLFFLLISPWLFALYYKYGYFMMAGTAKFNHGAAIYDNYEYMLRTVAPPNSHSIFAWEDPVLLSRYRDYQIFKSRENFLLQCSIVWKNLLELVNSKRPVYFIVFWGSLYMVFCWLHSSIKSGAKSVADKWFFRNNQFKLLFFSSLYLSGYLLFFLEERYVWTSLILSLIMLFYLFEKWFVPDTYQKLWIGFFGIFSLFLANRLLYSNYFKAPPFYNGIAVNEYNTAQQFRTKLADKKRMAKWPDNGGYTLFASWYTAYYAEAPHYFSLPASPEKANLEIEKHHISIVFASAGIPVPESIIFSTWDKVTCSIDSTIIYQRP